MNIIRKVYNAKWLLTAFLWTGCLSVSGAARALPSVPVQPDTCYLFRFVPGHDTFRVPYKGNETRLPLLCDTLKSNLGRLRSGQMYISVTSYAASGSRNTGERRMAYLRMSRVKSELILRAGVSEAMFVTDRRIDAPYGTDSLRDVVVVVFPAAVEKVARIAGREAARRVIAYNKEVYRGPETIVPIVPSDLQSDVPEYQDLQSASPSQSARTSDYKSAETMAHETMAHETTIHETMTDTRHAERSEASTPSLRFNLLRWATLTPDLGVEWRITPHIGILVNGAWTSWSWNDKSRRYSLWKLSPEVRYYIGKEKRGFLGAMYHLGEFNYKLNDTGKQGDYQGGAITGGYLLPLNNSLSLDFHAGLGYTHADYDKYSVTDGVRVRQGSDTKNYWGINQLGITLIWKMW